MTLQWTAVASFLYIEIGILVVFCLPFISAQSYADRTFCMAGTMVGNSNVLFYVLLCRWQMIFNLNIWNSIGRFWNKGFLAMIIILIVLFLDAVRDVRKYSGAEPSKEAKMSPNMFDHLHMKLFRAQRNLYISGFSLFLWLVMRRVIMLINQLAVATSTSIALQVQTEAANQAVRKYMEDIKLLKQALIDDAGEVKNAQNSELLKNKVQKLTEELKTSTEALKKSKSEMEVMKKQTESLNKEYECLLQEHQKLQNRTESEDKKDI